MVSSNKENKEEHSKSTFLSYVKDAIQKARNYTTLTFQNSRSTFLNQVRMMQTVKRSPSSSLIMNLKMS